MRWIVIAIVVLMLVPQAANAGPEPVPLMCTAETQGMLACQVNRVCECRRFRAVPSRGEQAGYRWDCSIMRPACAVPPADAYGYHGWLPSAVGIDRSSTTVFQGQEQFQSQTAPDTGTSGSAPD